MYIYIYVHICTYIYIYLCMCIINIHIQVYIHIYAIHMHLSLHMCISLSTYIYIYIYIFIYSIHMRLRGVQRLDVRPGGLVSGGPFSGNRHLLSKMLCFCSDESLIPKGVFRPWYFQASDKNHFQLQITSQVLLCWVSPASPQARHSPERHGIAGRPMAWHASTQNGTAPMKIRNNNIYIFTICIADIYSANICIYTYICIYISIL